jgi:hypothetical protein
MDSQNNKNVFLFYSSSGNSTIEQKISLRVRPIREVSKVIMLQEDET